MAKMPPRRLSHYTLLPQPAMSLVLLIYSGSWHAVKRLNLMSIKRTII